MAMAMANPNGGEDQPQGAAPDRSVQLRKSLELRVAVCRAIEEAYREKGISEVVDLEAECSAVIAELAASGDSFRSTGQQTTHRQILENHTAAPVRSTIEVEHTQSKGKQNGGQSSYNANAVLNASTHQCEADGTCQGKASHESNTSTITKAHLKPLKAAAHCSTERTTQVDHKTEDLEISALAEKKIVISHKKWRRVGWGAGIGTSAGCTAVGVLKCVTLLKAGTQAFVWLSPTPVGLVVGGVCLGAAVGYAYYCKYDNHCTVTVKVKDIFKHLPGCGEEKGIVSGTIKVDVSEYRSKETASPLEGNQQQPLDGEQEQDLAQLEAQEYNHPGLRKRHAAPQ